MLRTLFRATALRAASALATRATSTACPARALAVAAAGGSILAAASAVASAEPAPVISPFGEPGTKRERTLILVKPDGVERGIVGAVIGKFESKGYKLVGLKMLTPTLDQAKSNYAGLAKLPFFPSLCEYFASGPIVCMCWEGKDVIKTGRSMVDEVRAVYAADRGRNCIDGSDSVEGAAEGIDALVQSGRLLQLHSCRRRQDLRVVNLRAADRGAALLESLRGQLTGAERRPLPASCAGRRT
jgi:nucleoside-diphosphate kinase